MSKIKEILAAAKNAVTNGSGQSIGTENTSTTKKDDGSSELTEGIQLKKYHFKINFDVVVNKRTVNNTDIEVDADSDAEAFLITDVEKAKIADQYPNDVAQFNYTGKLIKTINVEKKDED